MTSSWLFPSILSLISFGLWGFFTKLTVNYVDSKTALIYQTLGVCIISFILLVTMKFKPMPDVKGFSYGLLTGAAYAIGCLLYFIAASRGEMVAVVTLTSLYPLVTILLSCLLLNESINIKQSIGIIFAFVSIWFLSG